MPSILPVLPACEGTASAVLAQSGTAPLRVHAAGSLRAVPSGSAASFVDAPRSPAGQAVLARHGFAPR